MWRAVSADKAMDIIESWGARLRDEERERCAKLCEEVAAKHRKAALGYPADCVDMEFHVAGEHVAAECAKAIRGE